MFEVDWQKRQESGYTGDHAETIICDDESKKRFCGS